MAEFLTTAGVSQALEEIVKSAEDRLVLISPYLDFNKHIKELIEDKNRLKIDVRIIYGKRELYPEVKAWLASMDFVRTSFYEDLHAKCYLNENKALLTSMNLYEFSQVNNYEMGILVSKGNDRDLYNAIFEESKQIVRVSKENKENPVTTTSGSVAQGPKEGFCIRCRAVVPTRPSRPYCNPCYARWARYNRDEYKEKHCHACGTKHQTSRRRPLCRDCFKKYPEFFKPRPATAPNA